MSSRIGRLPAVAAALCCLSMSCPTLAMPAANKGTQRVRAIPVSSKAVSSKSYLQRARKALRRVGVRSRNVEIFVEKGRFFAVEKGRLITGSFDANSKAKVLTKQLTRVDVHEILAEARSGSVWGESFGKILERDKIAFAAEVERAGFQKATFVVTRSPDRDINGYVLGKTRNGRKTVVALSASELRKELTKPIAMTRRKTLEDLRVEAGAKYSHSPLVSQQLSRNQLASFGKGLSSRKRRRAQKRKTAKQKNQSEQIRREKRKIVISNNATRKQREALKKEIAAYKQVIEDAYSLLQYVGILVPKEQRSAIAEIEAVAGNYYDPNSERLYLDKAFAKKMLAELPKEIPYFGGEEISAEIITGSLATTIPNNNGDAPTPAQYRDGVRQVVGAEPKAVWVPTALKTGDRKTDAHTEAFRIVRSVVDKHVQRGGKRPMTFAYASIKNLKEFANRKDCGFGEALFDAPLAVNERIVPFVKAAKQGNVVVGLSMKTLGGQKDRDTSMNPRRAVAIEVAEQIFGAVLTRTVNEAARKANPNAQEAVYIAGGQPVVNEFGSKETGSGYETLGQGLLSTSMSRAILVLGLPSSVTNPSKSSRWIKQIGGVQFARHSGKDRTLTVFDAERAAKQQKESRSLEKQLGENRGSAYAWAYSTYFHTAGKSKVDGLKGEEREQLLVEAEASRIGRYYRDGNTKAWGGPKGSDRPDTSANSEAVRKWEKTFHQNSPLAKEVEVSSGTYLLK